MLNKSDLTGALFAGGKSTRMGSDKCLIEYDGQPAWQRQLGLLRETCDEVLIVSRERPDWCPDSVLWYADAVENRGPLAGLATALERSPTPFVLALAVDLPNLTGDYLKSLVANSGEGNIGVVPVIDQLFQPLTAVYPTTAVEYVRAHMEQPDKSFQNLVRELLSVGLVRPIEVESHERTILRNANAPTD